MKIKFLGTGAADWPKERPAEYTEYRRLSAAVIDGQLLLDCGPQIPAALAEYAVDGVKYLLVTHRHGDHFNQEAVDSLTAKGVELVEMSAGQERQVGKYTVLAYAGNHDTCKTPTLHYIIKDGEHTLFYGLDGAWLLYAEWRGIKEHKPDLCVLDATVGFTHGDIRVFEHNNLQMVLEMKKTLDPHVKKICISHMARTLHTDHKTLAAAMEKEHILTAYDGMEIDLATL